MTKKQAQQIFEKYNSKEAVVRCPNGKAPLRKLLDSYARAAVNLYGIIPIKELAEIFNSQNKEKTTKDEIFMLLLPDIIKRKKTPEEGPYCFYKNCIIHYYAFNEFEMGDYWLSEQKGKPRYIPEKDEFLLYEDHYYEDPDQLEAWLKVLEFLKKNCNTWNKNDLINFYEGIMYSSHAFGIMNFDLFLDKFDLSFKNEKQLESFFELYMNAHNNTRMWANNGFKPIEIMEPAKPQRNQKDQVVIQEHKKVSPNELCPCGSGKKYKKCCYLTKRTMTAQLHWSDCNLFYETWYGLLNFINEKMNIIPAQIKPIYPNPLSDNELFKVREELWKNSDIITEYISSVSLKNDKKELLKSWRDHHIKGMFFLFEYKSEYAVVIGCDKNGNDKLFGIKGLSRPLSEVIQRELPLQIETVLLPFKNKIIYDSYLSSAAISFGEGFKKLYKAVLKEHGEKGIITSLL